MKFGFVESDFHLHICGKLIESKLGDFRDTDKELLSSRLICVFITDSSYGTKARNRNKNVVLATNRVKGGSDEVTMSFHSHARTQF